MRIKLYSPVELKCPGNTLVKGKAGEELIVPALAGNFLSSRGDAVVLNHHEGEPKPAAGSTLLKESLPPAPPEEEDESGEEDTGPK